MWNVSNDLTVATGRFSKWIRFVLVDNRVPRMDQHCALCGGLIEKGYVRDSWTQLISRVVQQAPLLFKALPRCFRS